MPVMKIQVEGYSGYKVNERPIKFWIGDKALFVESVEDQWRATDGIYFRVQADDGNTYVLRYSENSDAWTLKKSRDRQGKSTGDVNQ